MSATTGLLLAAAVLVIAVLAILLRPLLRAPKAGVAVDRRQANLDILRDQLQELERNRDEGTLSENDFEQARRELQRRLLEEVEASVEPARTSPATSRSGGRRTALALLIAVPLAAAGGYALLGTPQALDPVHAQAPMNAHELDGLLQRLADRLKANPDDAQGWIMLARSYKSLGRYAEAAEAFGHVGAGLNSEPALLSDYAETLALANGGRFDGKPQEMVERALKLNPEDPQTLYSAGLAAESRQDFAGVADYWGRLLLQVEPGSQDALALEAAVNEAREKLASQGVKPAAQPVKPGAAGAAAKIISGEVILSGKLSGQAKADDLLFVFARADEGSRMPIAVLRAKVADLPFSFRLDDSTAMAGGQKLSDFSSVTIEARISKAGMAQISSGDLFGTLKATKVGSQGIRLVIDQVQP